MRTDNKGGTGIEMRTDNKEVRGGDRGEDSDDSSDDRDGLQGLGWRSRLGRLRLSGLHPKTSSTPSLKHRFSFIDSKRFLLSMQEIPAIYARDSCYLCTRFLLSMHEIPSAVARSGTLKNTDKVDSAHSAHGVCMGSCVYMGTHSALRSTALNLISVMLMIELERAREKFGGPIFRAS